MAEVFPEQIFMTGRSKTTKFCRIYFHDGQIWKTLTFKGKVKKRKNINFVVPSYGWGSTASRLQNHNEE